MLTYDYRDLPRVGGSNQLPPQALPSNKKTQTWFEDTMDSLESIGMRQLSLNRARFEDAYRIVDGSFKYSDLNRSSVFLSEVDYLRNQASLGEELKYYGFIEPIVNTLTGDFIKQPNPTVIYTADPISQNDFLRARKDELTARTTQAINAEIELKLLKMGIDPQRQDFNSEEEKQAYMQQLEEFRKANIPEEVNKFMKTGWKPLYIEWAEKTLEENAVRFSQDELNRDLFQDYLKTGRCFKHWRVGFDFYRPERWSPLNTFTSTTQDERYPDKGDYVGRVQYLSPNQVITNYGQDLSEKQKKAILKSDSYSARTSHDANTNLRTWVEKGGAKQVRVPQENHIAYMNAGYLQEQTGIDFGFRDYFPNSNYNFNSVFTDNTERNDLIRVTEAYWVSYKRVGYLTYRKPDEQVPVSETVTEGILKEIINKYDIKQLRTVTLEQHIKNPQENTIVWDYIKEVRYGVKICYDNTDLHEDLYLYGDPIKYQLRGESNMFDTLLPVTGIVEDTSLVSRVEIDQIEYSMAMNMARDYMSKELGLFFLMDLSYIPQAFKEQGGEEALSKLMELARQSGIMPVDSTQARGTQFNQFQMVNMDLTAAMLGKLQFAESIRRRAFDKLGLSPERMGMPTEQKSATGVKISQSASYAQTDNWYDKFDKFLQRDAEMCINVAQWMQYEGKDRTIDFTDSDMTRQFITINDPNLPMRMFKVYPQNNSKRRSELELLKNIYMNDNTIEKNLLSMAEVVTSDSIATILKFAQIGQQEAQLAQLEAQKQQLALIEQNKLNQQELLDREHQYEMDIVRLKGQIELSKQALLGLGFAPEKDIDKNQIPDIVEQAKLSIQELERKFNQETKNKEMEMRQVKENRDFINKQKELNLKERELQVKQDVAQKQVVVAKTNKNRYDN